MTRFANRWSTKALSTLLCAFLLCPSLTSCTATAPALAQTNISALHEFSWGENVGWMNWRDANSGAQGVRVTSTYLSGYVWGENAGWISVGNGLPTGPGPRYTNATGPETGVNILVNGDLDGFAWAENVGWVNFGTAAALGVDRARYDAAYKGLANVELAGRFQVEAGDRIHLLLAYRPPEELEPDGPQIPGVDELDRRLESTIRWWRRGRG